MGEQWEESCDGRAVLGNLHQESSDVLCPEYCALCAASWALRPALQPEAGSQQQASCNQQ